MSLQTSKLNNVNIFVFISQMRKLRFTESKVFKVALWLESSKAGTKFVDCYLV